MPIAFLNKNWGKQNGRKNQKVKEYVLRKLFLLCLYLSTFTFGGGYVIVTLLKEKFVDHYHWIEEDEMLDLVAIAQSSPGAIAVTERLLWGISLPAYRECWYLS
mgnify:CR=1 FL=1